MPFLTKDVSYRISNITAVQNCKKYGIDVKIKDVIDINIYTLKQIAPMNKTIKLKCQCDNCKKEFDIEPRSYSLDEAKNNYILCYHCKAQKTMINKYGIAYAGQVPELLQKTLDTKTKKQQDDPNYQKNINLKTLKTIQKRYGKQYTSINQVPQIKAKKVKTIQRKYGKQYTNATQVPKIKEKALQTIKQKYNINNITSIAQVPEIKAKTQLTNLERYGNTCVLHSNVGKIRTLETIQKRYGKQYTSINQIPQIKAKKVKTIQRKYGKQYTNATQVPKIKAKVRKTMFKNGTAPTSMQQEYFHQLLGGELNYPLNHLSLDIALLDEKIDIEYNGGGHDLDVKLKGCTLKEFEQKEIRRNKFIRSQGWKQIFIISPNDKINLYTNEEYIKLIQISKDYLLNTSHHWVNIYIEENKIECSCCIESITNIIS